MSQQSFDFGHPDTDSPPSPEHAPGEGAVASPAADVNGERTASTVDWTPPDQAQRYRILSELDANLLVEAGAGSGKTTSMVGRMVELVRAGRDVDRIAAVTFTRKAAAELRERFQVALESAYRTAAEGGNDVERARFGTALDAVDRCFLGTIHSFCARLLRERPLEAGIPPDFEEISGPDEDRLRVDSWTRFLERLAEKQPSRLGRALASHALRPAQLQGAFREIADNPDVSFPAPVAPPLDPVQVAAVRRRLDLLLGESRRLLPVQEPTRGWDPLQNKLRRLLFRRRVVGWDQELEFMQALEQALQGKNSVTQNRWGEDGATKKAAKALAETWDDFCAEEGRARSLLETWWAVRYRVAIRFARAAAASYAVDRLRLGKLTFQDLLVRATALLRDHPAARRELGERYRWLLVDEFQDTDPVQAEMLLLLSSDPAMDPGRDPDPYGREPLWQLVVPRPGALFVVGDPKQSIYRFRRADVVVYNRVKARFREFGDILHLVTNFRSTRPIEVLVNQVFQSRFPERETEHQAEYAPLRVRPDRTSGSEGIYCYSFEPLATGGPFSGRRIAEAECHLLASWVRQRIDRHERKPGDFMILASRKSELATYARALEAQGVPVQVTGAGVGVDEELSELILLLRALADPEDPILILAVLEGLFFGLSHQDLHDHARAGGRFTLLMEPPAGSPASHALDTLRRFWEATRHLPADVAVAKIVEGLGILPWAAAGDLGATRAGAVVYALDTLRAAARDGCASLHEAIELLEAALEQEVDAPLIPGETNAVRVMNLHKAKGLEAPVVVLAYPASLNEHALRRHVARDAAGEAVGWLSLVDPTQAGNRIIAQPADWSDHEAAEAPFQEAEEVRRLYVAATRAAEELVIARCDRTADGSCWSPLHEALDRPGIAIEIALTEAPPPERERLTTTVGEIEAQIQEAADARRRLGRPSYRAWSVTARVHGQGPGAVEQDPELEVAELGVDVELLYLAGPGFRAPAGPSPEPRGTEWGSAVHRAMEAAARGAQGQVLRRMCRAALREFERPLDAQTGEPVELAELVGLVEAVRTQPVWDRVRGARRVLVEAPFSLALSADQARRVGVTEPAEVEVLEGTIDLALQDPDGRWTVVDFKTDARQDPERERAYRRQLLLYALGVVVPATRPAPGG